jgi:anti-sigma-K factor RskA
VSTDHDLLGAYCTDALDPAERAEFEAHLATCGPCRAEAAEFREVLAALAEAHPVRPPADLEDRVVAGVRGSAGPVGDPGPVGDAGPVGDGSAVAGAGSVVVATPRRGWSRAATWMAAAAAGAVLFAVGVGVGRGQAPESLTASQTSDALAVASAADAHVMDVDIMGTTSRLVVSDEMGKSVFLASELPTPAKGMCYQVWRVTDDGQMVSAGAFTPGSDGHIVAVLDGGGQDVAKFMITMEPPGGSDHPTGEMLGEIDA